MSQDRFEGEESNGVICLSKKKTFSDETTFLLSTPLKSLVLIELGQKNSWSDQIKPITKWANMSTTHFCKHDYSLKAN